MTATLEDLYLAVDGDSPAYDAARKAKGEEIALAIEPYLASPLEAAAYAERLMSGAEEMGRINGDTVDVEVPSIWTRDGQPRPMTV